LCPQRRRRREGVSQSRGKGKKICVPLKGGKDPLAGRGLAHGTNESRQCYPYGRCKNLSTSHRAGPPSLFPGTRPFLFVMAVAGRTKICVPLKGGKGPPWRVGGSHTGQTRADGVTRTVGVKTHPPAIGLVPLPFQGRTKDFPFPRDQAVPVRHSRRGKDKRLPFSATT